MAKLQDIITPVEAEFQKVKELLKSGMRSEYKELDSIARHLLSLRGKMMRPALTLLSAGLCGEINDRTLNIAATIEYLHSATLVHDDVIDEAYTRHNQLTLSTVLRSHQSVLVGDYMFAKGLLLTSKVKAYQELDKIIEAIEALVEGELKQSKGVSSLSVTREDYFDIARLKTGSLIGAAAEVGAISVGASAERCLAMREFGQAVGVAFQAQDDILDYMPNSKSGKTPYNDIKERKITLPLLCAMDKGGRGILSALRKGNTQKVIDFVEANDGVKSAQDHITRLLDLAISLLDNFEDSEYKESLRTLALFAGNRNK